MGALLALLLIAAVAACCGLPLLVGLRAARAKRTGSAPNRIRVERSDNGPSPNKLTHKGRE